MIERIVVGSEPFKEKTREDTNATFANQLEVFAIVAMSFSSKMKNPIRRDEVFKNMLDNSNKNFLIFDGLHYQAIFVDDAVMLSIESA